MKIPKNIVYLNGKGRALNTERHVFLYNEKNYIKISNQNNKKLIVLGKEKMDLLFPRRSFNKKSLPCSEQVLTQIFARFPKRIKTLSLTKI